MNLCCFVCLEVSPGITQPVSAVTHTPTALRTATFYLVTVITKIASRAKNSRPTASSPAGARTPFKKWPHPGT
ncbi:hypothetical protein AMEX_G27470 [Astyanax mexicanus]|uniref:Uncharacterized protein n=1 Tax=Astyanax mexicanus TaxID=7994 RepID=A0A8T2KMV8_ASTMX|nr:hypothetical protein AMEX_G27470 [Astyanax mexicanus]